jgi:hypothetical protein
MTDNSARLRLSKSKLVLFERCRKALWLQVHRPELARLDPHTLALFRTGHIVGDYAQRRLPGGVLVSAKPSIEAAVQRTRELLASGSSRPIFEATFLHQDVLVRSDVLEPDGRGGWRMAEVKNAMHVGSHHIHDVAFQAWTALGQGARISSFVIRHPASKVRDEADLADCVLTDTDVTWHVLGLVPRKTAVIEAARACVRGPEPVRPVGPYCSRPFTCAFNRYCRKSSNGQRSDEL